MRISGTAHRVLVRLLAAEQNWDRRRARERQMEAAERGCTLAQVVAVFREEMSYTPADRTREECYGGQEP